MKNLHYQDQLCCRCRLRYRTHHTSHHHHCLSFRSDLLHYHLRHIRYLRFRLLHQHLLRCRLHHIPSDLPAVQLLLLLQRQRLLLLPDVLLPLQLQYVLPQAVQSLPAVPGSGLHIHLPFPVHMRFRYHSLRSWLSLCQSVSEGLQIPLHIPVSCLPVRISPAGTDFRGL